MPHVPRMLKSDGSVFEECHPSEDNGSAKKFIGMIRANILGKYNMSRDTTKPVFGVFDKVTFKPACSATETS